MAKAKPEKEKTEKTTKSAKDKKVELEQVKKAEKKGTGKKDKDIKKKKTTPKKEPKTTDKKEEKTDKNIKKETTTEDKKEDKPKPQAKPVKPSDKSRWFVIHTYSGHENKAAEALKQRVDAMNLKHKIFDIVVPTRNVVLVRHGKKHESKEKIFPGYILVKMELDDESWLAVRTAPGVTSFVGTRNKPTPISDKEVEAIMKFMKLEAPKFKAKFTVGEAVKIVDGPFADFLGTVESIDEARGKVKVLVSIFGRETPVELDFLQVNKL